MAFIIVSIGTICAHKQQDGRHDSEGWNIPNTVSQFMFHSKEEIMKKKTVSMNNSKID